MVDLLILIYMAHPSRIPQCGAVITSPSRGRWVNLMKSVSDYLVRDLRTCGLTEVILYGSTDLNPVVRGPRL